MKFKINFFFLFFLLLFNSCERREAIRIFQENEKNRQRMLEMYDGESAIINGKGEVVPVYIYPDAMVALADYRKSNPEIDAYFIRDYQANLFFMKEAECAFLNTSEGLILISLKKQGGYQHLEAPERTVDLKRIERIPNGTNRGPLGGNLESQEIQNPEKSMDEETFE